MSRQINKDTVYKEAPTYACLFLNEVFFLRIFFKEDSDSSIDTSHNKYILIQHGNILKIMFLLKENNTLKGLENNA